MNSHNKLLEIFRKLFQDLKNGKMDTLSDYLACIYQISNITNRSPSSEGHVWDCQNLYCSNVDGNMDLGKKFVHRSVLRSFICRARKIWQFSQQIIYQENKCSVFDGKATATKCQNKLFKAKLIRNDMILHQS